MFKETHVILYTHSAFMEICLTHPASLFISLLNPKPQTLTPDKADEQVLERASKGAQFVCVFFPQFHVDSPVKLS